MSGRKRSSIWQHFSADGNKGSCNYCAAVLSVKNGNVSNLSRHLKHKHPAVNFRKRESSIVIVQNDQEQPEDVTFELEEDPSCKRDPEVAAAYRVRWASKSEVRERRRSRNSEGKFKIPSYIEPMDDSEDVEGDELVTEVTRPFSLEAVPKAKAVVAAGPPREDDSDRHFLLSLLPLMKKLKPEDNMDIRINIHNAIREKLFPPKNRLVDLIEEVVDAAAEEKNQ